MKTSCAASRFEARATRDESLSAAHYSVGVKFRFFTKNA